MRFEQRIHGFVLPLVIQGEVADVPDPETRARLVLALILTRAGMNPAVHGCEYAAIVATPAGTVEITGDDETVARMVAAWPGWDFSTETQQRVLRSITRRTTQARKR